MADTMNTSEQPIDARDMERLGDYETTLNEAKELFSK